MAQDAKNLEGFLGDRYIKLKEIKAASYLSLSFYLYLSTIQQLITRGQDREEPGQLTAKKR